MKTISSSDNPLTKTIRRLRARPARDGEHRFLLEGIKLVREALASGVRLEQALLTPSFADSEEGRALTAALESAAVPRARVTARLFRSLTEQKTPEGVLAIGRGTPRRLEDIHGTVVVVPVEVRDPGNWGAIARVAEAAGASALVSTPGSADPFQPKALRGSMGSLLRLPVYRAESAEKALRLLRSKGYRIVSTVPRGGLDFREANLAPPLALVLGGESHGLGEALRALSDVEISLPMSPPVESLNVAVVAGVVLYEVRRRPSRRQGGKV